jgi:serine/threonine protein kinase/Flp pilus assembly protein TadD
MTAAADRHLLFGLLALQTGIIDHGQLILAFQAWIRDKSKSLADHMEGRGDLDIGDRAAVEGLMARHIKRHGGNVEQSLAAVPANRSTRASLTKLGEPEIEATLARVARSKNSQATEADGEDDPERTASMSVGGSTSEGQRFRILRPHARGGLGAVFVALDSELHREVALKQILENHADDPPSRDRFVAEAEITGGLEHPGVVPVYGLGTYDSGRPYYAMRFIKGDSLKEAIKHFHADKASKNDFRQHSLELRKLLRRFLDVCNAIDYAHSRGVIHRDIKPANIILGKHGETLVVDWGLAKVVGRVDPSGGEQTIAPSSGGSSDTVPGSVLGTPAYMSSEQASGDLDQVGPLSDVYSLGATLYCLLTGKPPFAGDDIGEILRKVRTGNFLAPREVNPTLDKALEAICTKAMATGPADRYATCRALAEDIERWMADETVAAYHDPWMRTLSRWLTRHRTGVTAAAAALLVGLVGLGSVAAVQTRARNDLDRTNGELTAANTRVTEANADLTQANIDLDLERRRAEANETEAISAVKKFRDAVATNPELKNNPSLEQLRKTLLKEPLAFFKSLCDRLQAARDTRPKSLERLAEASFDLGTLTQEIGDRQDALIAYRGSLATYQKLADSSPAVAEYQSRLANSHLSLAAVLKTTGDFAAALKATGFALEIFQKLADASPTVTEFRSRLGYCHYRLGTLLYQQGKMTDAEAEYLKAVVIRQKLADDNPAATEFRSRLAESHFGLGILLGVTGKLAEADSRFYRALEIFQKLADENPSVTEFRHRLASCHGDFGAVLANSGKLPESEIQRRKALAIQQQLADENPAITDFHFKLAVSRSNLGNLLMRKGKLTDAEAEYRKASATFQKLVDDNSAVTEFRDCLATSHDSIGKVLSAIGKPAEAEAEFHQALAIHQKLADLNPADFYIRMTLAESHLGLGNAQQKTGMPLEAEIEYRAAIAVYHKLAAENPAVAMFQNDLAGCHRGLGKALSATGKPAEAEPEYLKSIAIAQKLVDDNPADTDARKGLADGHNNLGRLLARQKRFPAAFKALDAGLAIHRKLTEGDRNNTVYTIELGSSFAYRGGARVRVGQTAEATADLRQALGLWANAPNMDIEKRFERARAQALLAGLSKDPTSGVTAAEAASFADQSVAALRDVISSGWAQLNELKQPDFDTLRDRQDFQNLMAAWDARTLKRHDKN